MNNFIYHNNYHRSNHHTIPLDDYIESSKDPIASLNYPFFGLFYNNFYNQNNIYIAQSNSYEWWSAYTLTNSKSATWNKYSTTYTTVKTNSAFWNKAYDASTIIYQLSSNWQSTYLNLNSNIEYWNAVYDSFTLYYNQTQENTKQKTFKNVLVFPDNVSNITLNLTANQISTYIINQNSNFTTFEGGKRGGIYHLILYTSIVANPSFQIIFSNKFKMEGSQNIFNINDNRMIKFEFLCDGVFLHGKNTQYF
jgi:hypothetical protein